MHHHYADIRDRIDEEPQWFDEDGVPRYCAFHPTETADIYADEAILLLIECQSCGHEFPVCISASKMGRYRQALTWAAMDAKRDGRVLTDEDVSAEWEKNTLAASVERGRVHYGDPPNADCCLAGASMNSVPVRVLEFWRRGEGTGFDWQRVSELEIAIPDRFADEPDEVLLPETAAPRPGPQLETPLETRTETHTETQPERVAEQIDGARAEQPLEA